MPKRKLIKPNFELLRNAYAIFDGIPEDRINLNSILTKRGASTSCGTIACGMGFLTLHPQFQALGLRMPRGDHVGACLLYKDNGAYYADAAAKVFQIKVSEATGIFAAPHCEEAIYDQHLPKMVTSDKELLLARIIYFLKSKKQLISNAIQQ